ncbi:MAG TPA: NAD(P)-binding protein, partial [Planctomycetaceae bacterium]|nr:NAD(P)-binding protein [Planctomycetaceae bacterium]
MTAHEPTAELDFAVPMDATELLKENARRFAIERPVRPRNFEAWLRLPESAAPLPRTDSQLPVLVVGAGPAGLAAMAELRRADVNCEGIEFHSQVGGIWDQSNPLSSVYDSLTTNTSRYTTHLGPPMPREWPDYPHHRQAHGYLERFAAEAGIL